MDKAYKTLQILRLTLALTFFLIFSRQTNTTPDLNTNTMFSSSSPFLILPRLSHRLHHSTVPYICSSPTLRSTACQWPAMIVLKVTIINTAKTDRVQMHLANFKSFISDICELHETMIIIRHLRFYVLVIWWKMVELRN